MHSAVRDLARRLQIDQGGIEVREVREVVWPDAGLGCPEPGRVYEPVRTPGRLIRLSAGGRIYHYHVGGARKPVFCEQAAQSIRFERPKTEEFVPPPDADID